MEPTISTFVDESTMGYNTFFISLDTTITLLFSIVAENQIWQVYLGLVLIKEAGMNDFSHTTEQFHSLYNSLSMAGILHHIKMVDDFPIPEVVGLVKNEISTIL